MRREVHWVRHLNRLFAVLAVLVARAAAGCQVGRAAGAGHLTPAGRICAAALPVQRGFEREAQEVMCSCAHRGTGGSIQLVASLIRCIR